MVGLFRKRGRGSDVASSGGGLPDQPIFRQIGCYLLGIVIVLAVLLLRFILVSFVGELPPFLLFYPAVMLVAVIGGLGPGVFATLLSGMAADYFIIAPRGEFAVSNSGDAVALIIFFLMGFFISLIAELYQRSRHKVSTLEKQKVILEAEARFRALFENALDAMLLTKPEG
jgi:K+-sensing histidine kinase KdpD